jgi:hypothetical protein
MKTMRSLVITILILMSMNLFAQYPEAEISNGILTAKMYLPDAEKGYYRSTRFDWSGAIYSLKYSGHEYYGTWYDRIDPKIINWVFQGSEIVAGSASALCGPVNEFQLPLGYIESKPGETFIKIGVGVLRRIEGNYNRYVPYDVLNSGKWSVKKGADQIEFTQELTDPNTGYAYLYRKLIRLEKGKPGMVIEHSLKNTGSKEIKSQVYNHNFIVIDKQAPGPDLTFKVPYKIKATQTPKKELAEIRDNQFVYLKQLSGEDEAVAVFTGFSNDIKDTEIIIENHKVGAGIKISGDRPLIRGILWSLRSVIAIEPYMDIDIKPGEEFTWKNIFDYYTLKN